MRRRTDGGVTQEAQQMGCFAKSSLSAKKV